MLGVGGASSSYQIRLQEALSENSHAFGRRLRELDAKLAVAYGTRLPPGEVWVDPDAFKGKPIGGTYEWFSDRIVIVQRDEGYLAHELVHRYNHFTFGDLPRWLDEGIAYALARGGLEGLERPQDRRPDFEAINDVRDAFERGRIPSLEDVFDDPYANGHLNLRIVTVIADRLLRDNAQAPTFRAALAAVVRSARDLTPDAAAGVLRRAALETGPGGFPRDDELLALLSDETLPDELVRSLAGKLLGADLEVSIQVASRDARARRRLALLLDREVPGEPSQVSNLPRRYLESLLRDKDPRVVRAAVYALGARGDERMIGPLIEILKEAPLFRWIHPHAGGGASYDPVPIQHTLVALAGEVPKGVREAASISSRLHPGANAYFDEAEPPSYRTVEAWERWFAERPARPNASSPR